MSIASTIKSPKPSSSGKDGPAVNMAQIQFVSEPDRVHAVVGSCIGLTLYCPQLRLGGLAHIVLPKSGGRNGAPGKFADTAIPHMVEYLERKGATRSKLVAKFAGGANMFASKGTLQIGQDNADAVRSLLSDLGIRVVAEQIGGSKGRRMTFDPSDGKVVVEIAGKLSSSL